MESRVVTIASRPYRLQCGPGEAARLEALARHVEERAQRTLRAHGNPGEAMLLLLVSLMLADEVEEARAEIARLKAEVERATELAAERGAAALAAAAARLNGLVARVRSAGEEGP
jgi:cell division protein ZapA